MENSQPESKPESPEEQAWEGLAAVACSEIYGSAAIAAINGYLKNRYLLCEQLSEISSTYDREKDRRKCLEAQIDIVDRQVIEILHFQNAEAIHGEKGYTP